MGDPSKFLRSMLKNNTITPLDYKRYMNRLGGVVPGRVQSRINLENEGLRHTYDAHFNPARTGKSQFTISKEELRKLLGRKDVVQTKVQALEGSSNYGRTVDVGSNIGFDAFTKKETSTMTVISDEYGNLLSAFPGSLR